MNMVMVGLTILMHFQQFEDFKFLFFPGEHAPAPPYNPCRVSNCPKLGRIVPILLKNPKNATRLLSGHKYPNGEDQLSQANERRNIFLLNYPILFVI